MTTSIHDLNASTAAQSARLFRESPESALAGSGLFSIETSPIPASSVIELATNSPDRFLSLVAFMVPLIQDILIQYYLLGRTYDQIGDLLFPRLTDRRQAVKTGNRIGVRALAVAASCGGDVSTIPTDSPLRSAWSDMLNWSPSTGGRIRVRAPRDLGDFVIHPNGQLGELFAPRWSVLGPRASTGDHARD